MPSLSSVKQEYSGGNKVNTVTGNALVSYIVRPLAVILSIV